MSNTIKLPIYAPGSHIILLELDLILDTDLYEQLKKEKIKVSYSNRNWRAYIVKSGKMTYIYNLIWKLLGNDIPEGMVIDHINSNSLDNRLQNLRLVTTQQNLFNKQPSVGGSSKYKGVSWIKSRKKWKSQIKLDGKTTNIGMFASEEDAKEAYDKKAKELFGKYAYLNSIEVSNV